MLSWRGTNVDLDVAQSRRRRRVAHQAVAHGREALTPPLQLPCNHGVDRGSSLFTQLDHPIRNRSLMTNCPVSVRSHPGGKSNVIGNQAASPALLSPSLVRLQVTELPCPLRSLKRHPPAWGGQ